MAARSRGAIDAQVPSIAHWWTGATRATIKALPAPLHRPRPYGCW